jgi:hypothetical protein
MVLVLSSSFAFANYSLLSSRKPIVCFADDNQSIVYNVEKSTLKYTIEGESRGPKKIVNSSTNWANYLIVTSSELTLQLSNQGDFFKFPGDARFTKVECHLSK